MEFFMSKDQNGILDVLMSKTAPAQGGKPVFEKDIEFAKIAGAKNYAGIIGRRISDQDEKTCSTPLNFGSKASTGMLPDDTRIRLFGLKKAVNDAEVQAQYMFKSRYVSPSQIKETENFKHILTPMLKAFNITDFDSFIVQAQSRFYFEEYEIPLMLADLFDQLPMDSSIVRVPGVLGLLEGQLETDDAAFSPQYNTQESYLVESKNNVVHTKITQDLLSDSSPAIIDKLRKEVVKGIARAYERAILDGDTSGVPAGSSHLDEDYAAGSAKLFVKGFHGLRKRAFDNEAAIVAGGGAANQIVYDHANDTASKALFSELLKRLKCQGAEKDDLQWIMGCTIGHDLVTGAIPELFTAYAFGGLASNVTGELPPVFGIKGVISSKVREDLAGTGKRVVATPDTTQTYMLLVQKSRFANWTRQATRVWASPSLPSSDEMLMSAKARHAFDGTPQSLTERSVVMGINIKTV